MGTQEPEKAKDTEELMDEAQEKEQARKEDLGPRSESLRSRFYHFNNWSKF